MYITTLHFELGRTFIDKVDDNVDAEEFVSDKYGLDSTFYMTTSELNLIVNTI
jgi:hypothetical protein